MPWMLQLFMFIVSSLLVYEKECGLREMMKMMGLGDLSYWLVNYFFYLIQYLFVCIIMAVMGNGAGMRFFSLHSSFVVWSFLFVWGNCMTALSMLLSLFFKTSRTSTVVILLYILVIINVCGTIMGQLVNSPDASESMWTPMMIFPNNAMLRMMYWLAYSAGRGEAMTLDNWGTFGDGVMPRCLIYLIIQWIICLILIWYLEKVMGGSASSGVKQPHCFCCKRRYWEGRKSAQDPAAGGGFKAEFESVKAATADCATPLLAADALPPDVLEEHNRVIASDDVELDLEGGAADGSKTLARLVAMSKTYDAVGNAAAKKAVRMVSLGLDREMCFGLLGQNGAGKSTM